MSLTFVLFTHRWTIKGFMALLFVCVYFKTKILLYV